jgi:hypothetical protein
MFTIEALGMDRAAARHRGTGMAAALTTEVPESKATMMGVAMPLCDAGTVAGQEGSAASAAAGRAGPAARLPI